MYETMYETITKCGAHRNQNKNKNLRKTTDLNAYCVGPYASQYVLSKEKLVPALITNLFKKYILFKNPFSKNVSLISPQTKIQTQWHNGVVRPTQLLLSPN